jgi:8-oxo-dGTP diphosphatase
MDEKFRYYAAAFLVLRDKDTVLLLLRKNTGHADGKYSFVAGHVDGNETAQQAIVREAFEEAGIVVKESDLDVVHVQHYRSEDREYFNIFITAEAWSGNIENKEPNKCEELVWFPISALPDNTIDYIKDCLRHVESGNFYSNFGFSS